jgi:tetratricopeptide (TPR) repeat protein
MSETADQITTSKRLRGSTFLGCAIVATAAIIVGRPTLGGAFLSGDDHRLILDHYLVTHPSAKSAMELMTIVHGDLYQPLPMLSFQANYAMSSRDAEGKVSPRAFHWTNVLLHAVNAAMVFLLMSRVAECRRIGLLTGLFFAVHPFAIEAVAWIGGRMVLLMSFFALLCWLIRTSPRGAGLVGSLVAGLAWLCSLASKVLPTGPMAGALMEGQCRHELRKSTLRFHGACLVMAVIAGAYALRTTRAYGVMEDTGAGGSFVLLLAAAIRYYLGNYILPVRLSPWVPEPSGESAWINITMAVGGTMLLFGIARAAWGREGRAAVGILIFVVLLAPFLITSAARSTVAADRYMYLPIMGLHLALASLLVRLWDILLLQRRRLVLAATIGTLFVGTLIGFWQFESLVMAEVWRDSISRDRRSMEIHPDDVRSHARLAVALCDSSDHAGALGVVDKARKRWKDDPRLAVAAGRVELKLGNHAAAIAELRKAVDVRPGDLPARHWLAIALSTAKRTDEAIEEYRTILRRNPGYLPALTTLGNLLLQSSKLDEAAELFKDALRINNHDLTALHAMGIIEMRRENWPASIEYFRRALVEDPDRREWPAWINYAVCLTRLERYDEALAEYDRLVERHPDIRELRANRAAVLVTVGRVKDAENEYRALLRIDKRGYTPMIGLTELMMKSGRREELPKLWEDFVARHPDMDWARAWQALSLSLAGKGPEASKVAQTVASNSDYKPLANWALAVDALRRKDGEGVLRALGPPRRALPIPSERSDEGRVISLVLMDLPKELSETAAGRYMLARSFYHHGQDGAARLSLALYYPDANPLLWESADKALLDQLPHSVTTTRSTSDE